MRRRDFIRLIGHAAGVWPVAAYAQQTANLPVIGVLQHNASGFRPWGTAFENRLRELNWIEGRTVAIEYRWSEGRPERVAEVATEFVQQKVAVIVAYGSAAVTLKKATASIPIVFAPANDPVGTGLVSTLSHPGGNVTGISLQQAESAGKRFELLRRAVPSLRRLGILFDSGYSAAVHEMEEVQAIARSLGVEVEPRGIRRADEIAAVIDGLKDRADALYVVENALTGANGLLIVKKSLDVKIPVAFTSAEFGPAGALMSYGPNFPTVFARVAEIVDKILHATNPGDIPVEQPTKFDLVINLKAAKTLGLTIPENLLIVADKVIE
jgi:putative tryptophan/tyrosine transport system substrate-binding protein